MNRKPRLQSLFEVKPISYRKKKKKKEARASIGGEQHYTKPAHTPLRGETHKLIVQC